MRAAFPIRFARRRGFLRGLGAPVLPDNFTTAAGVPESFSPGTADATIMQILQQQGQQLPPALAAAMAAGVASTTYVQPKPPSPLTLSVWVAPGVWQWTRADGSTFYGDVSGNPVSYTPPAVSPAGTVLTVPPALNTPPAVTATPATTPAASLPTAAVAPAVTSTPQQTATPAATPVAVTAAGAPISTTSGNTSGAQAPSPATGSFIDSALAWLQGSLIGGIPNWLLLGGAAALLMLDDGSGGGSRRRR